MWMEQLGQALGQVDQIFPSNAAAGTYNSVGVDMSRFHRALWVIELGAFTSGGTVNITLQTAANSNFNAGVHNLTVNTNFAQVTSGGANTVVTVELQADSVTNQNPGDRYGRVSVVIGTAAVNFSVTGFGAESNHKPVQSLDVNTTEYIASP
jgi:hypothetical protein